MAGCSTRRLRSRSAGGGDGRIRRLQDRRRCRCSRRGDRHGSFSRRGLGRHQARLDPPTHPATDIGPARPYRGSALWDPAHRPNSLTAALDSPVRPAEQRFRYRRAPRGQGRLADLSEDHRRLRRHQPPPRKTRDDQADRIDPASRARWAGGDRPTWPHPMAPPRRHPGVLRPPRLQRPNRSHQRTLGSPAPQRPRIPQPHPLPNPLTATQRRTPPTRQCTLKYEEPVNAPGGGTVWVPISLTDHPSRTCAGTLDTANVTKSRIKHREHRAPSPVGWAPNKEKSLRAQPSYRGAEARELGEAPNGTLRCTVVIRGNAERLQGWVRPCAVRRDTACNRRDV